jgi:hypothetical protein
MFAVQLVLMAAVRKKKIIKKRKAACSWSWSWSEKKVVELVLMVAVIEYYVIVHYFLTCYFDI